MGCGWRWGAARPASPAVLRCHLQQGGSPSLAGALRPGRHNGWRWCQSLRFATDRGAQGLPGLLGAKEKWRSLAPPQLLGACLAQAP